MQDPSSFPAVKLQYPEQEQLKCPRCDSSNTKFCYYNNYNLSQPRYFCKNCRRYWTKGGTLRNIPVGGGSRKNNKRSSNSKRSSSSQAPTQTPQPLPAATGPTRLDNPGGSGMDDRSKLLEQGTSGGSLSFLMGSNVQFGSLLEGPSPSGSDKYPGNDTISSSTATGYMGMQNGETSYWSGANVWPDIANFDPPRSSIQ